MAPIGSSPTGARSRGSARPRAGARRTAPRAAAGSQPPPAPAGPGALRRSAGGRAGLAVVLGVALTWRLLLAWSLSGGPLWSLQEWSESDMATFVAQAQRVAAGDWSLRAPLYPYHSWMQAVPREEWSRWHPPAMCYQPPLYSVWLALLMAAGANAVAVMRALQVAMGVASCGLLFVVVRRALGTATGVAAGLVLAVYGPLVVAESQILRDGPIVLWTLLVLAVTVDTLALVRRGALPPRRWLVRALLAGILLGVQATLHEGAVLLACAVVLCGVAAALARRDRRAAATWAAGIALGAGLGYGPMLARNLAVGAPLGPSYFGSALAFATANHPDVPGASRHAVLTNGLPEHPERFAALMREAQGSVPVLAAGIARDYGDRWSDWPRLWLWRAGALCLGRETNENLSYAYFALRAPVLRASPGFRVLLPLALAGVAALPRRRWRILLRGPLGVVALHGVLAAGMISLVHPFGRYRLMLLPLLAPLAGLALVRLWRALRRRRLGRVAALLALAGVAAAAQSALGRIPPYDRMAGLRAAEFIRSAGTYLDRGDTTAARREIEEGVKAVPGDRTLWTSRALVEALDRHRTGDFAGAASAYEEALRLSPGDPAALQGLASARARRPLVLAPRPPAP
jgi:hypothetical protein